MRRVASGSRRLEDVEDTMNEPRSHPEAGASAPKDPTKLCVGNAVGRTYEAACTQFNLIHCVGSAHRRKVPHGGFAAARDDI